MTESFLQFVLDVIRRECAGLKAEVYDEREKSLTWIIDSFARTYQVCLCCS